MGWREGMHTMKDYRPGSEAYDNRNKRQSQDFQNPALVEIANRERAHLEKNAMQYTDLRRAKLELLEMEEMLRQAKFVVRCKELHQITLKAFAKDERLCQIKLTEIEEWKSQHQSKMASLHEKRRQADLAVLDAEEMVEQTKLMAQYEKLRQATQTALAFSKPLNPPPSTLPKEFSVVWNKLDNTTKGKIIGVFKKLDKNELSKNDISGKIPELGGSALWVLGRIYDNPNLKKEFYKYWDNLEADFDRFKDIPLLSDKYQKKASEKLDSRDSPDRRIMGQKIPDFNFTIPLKKF